MYDAKLPLFQHHSRHWGENCYVYPVISRRSRGLSIGINLNPDTACNFDCVYCQVDRTVVPRVREVDLARCGEELQTMIDLAVSGDIFADQTFADLPPGLRRVSDIAFSGDGEPTTCRVFLECVQLAASLKRRATLDDAKIVLITDACYLTRPDVVEALAVMDQNNGEIWAKLDAGTEAYYRRVNRPNYPLSHVMKNIIAAARVRPVVIQSLFMKLDGAPPNGGEIAAFCDRLLDILSAGGRISYVQVYTIARRPAEGFVTALTNEQVDEIAATISNATGLRSERFYGTS